METMEGKKIDEIIKDEKTYLITSQAKYDESIRYIDNGKFRKKRGKNNTKYKKRKKAKNGN